MTRMLDLTGQTFGNWFVIMHLGSINPKYNATYWLCRCSCGIEKPITNRNLRGGLSKSCGAVGCRSRDQYKNKPSEYGGSFSQIYKQYQTHAIERSLVFDIDYHTFYSMTQDICHYCGIIPSRIFSHMTCDNFTYNGIDRVHNHYGYTYMNCVTCCAECNHAKATLSYTDYIDLCMRVANKHSGNQNS